MPPASPIFQKQLDGKQVIYFCISLYSVNLLRTKNKCQCMYTVCTSHNLQAHSKSAIWWKTNNLPRLEVITRSSKCYYTLSKIVLHARQNGISRSAKYYFTLGKMLFYTLGKMLFHARQNAISRSAKCYFTLSKMFLHAQQNNLPPDLGPFNFFCIVFSKLGAMLRLWKRWKCCQSVATKTVLYTKLVPRTAFVVKNCPGRMVLPIQKRSNPDRFCRAKGVLPGVTVDRIPPDATA